jgi:hypothetical protein
MLVPANRPADAVALIGMPQSELISNAAVATVLRSWEERFGAVATAVGPGTVDVMAMRPPRSDEDALRLAVEQVAIAPEGELGSARDLAADLRTQRRGAYTTPRHWVFGWPD